jgi:hypothetical protein
MSDRLASIEMRAEKRARLPQKIHVLTPSECAVEPARDYVIKGLLSKGDHAAMIGLPGSAKSALAPFLGYRTALGLDVFGHRTRPTTVLYIAAEDGTGMKQRVKALYERMGDAPNFFLQPVPVDFLSPESPHVEDIEALIAAHQPGLVILDTIARAFPGLRENESEGMAHVVKVARGFTMICNSAVLSLHHPPKAGEKTPRGHSNFNGDLDMTLFVEGAGSATRYVTMGKNRSGPSDLTFCFNVGIADFGEDEDGDRITAPVAEPVEGVVTRKPKLTATEKSALSFLADLVCEGGRSLPSGSGFPLNVDGVEITAWRDACERRSLSTAETPKDRSRVFRKVSGDLRDKAVIGMCEGFVWLTGPGIGG